MINRMPPSKTETTVSRRASLIQFHLFLIVFPIFAVSQGVTSIANLPMSLVIFAVFFAYLLVSKHGIDILASGFRSGATAFRTELLFTLFLTFMSFLSLINAEDPLRIIRIVYPMMGLSFFIILFGKLLFIGGVGPLIGAVRLFVYVLIVFNSFLYLASKAVPTIAQYAYALGYRYIGFMENANQQSIILSMILTMYLGCFTYTISKSERLLTLPFALVSLVSLIDTGGKTAMFLFVAASVLFVALVKLKDSSALGRIIYALIIPVLVLNLLIFGIDLVALVNPEAAEKISRIFDGGVGEYHSILSREELWEASIDIGWKYPIVGSGAGSFVLNYSHAHNLVLDYFRGIGLFGSIAVATMCVFMLSKTAFFLYSFIISSEKNRLYYIFIPLFLASSLYILVNQLSDSFGPGTIFTLWMSYVPALYLAGEIQPRREVARAIRPSPPPTAPRLPPASFPRHPPFRRPGTTSASLVLLICAIALASSPGSVDAAEPSFANQNFGSSPLSLKPDHSIEYDFRGSRWELRISKNDDPTPEFDCHKGNLPINKYPIVIRGTMDVGTTGGFVDGRVPQESDWRSTYCNSAAMQIGGRSVVISKFHARNVWDGIRIAAPGKVSAILDRVWIENARDDCVENDGLHDLEISNSLLDGCFMGVSLAPNCGKDDCATTHPHHSIVIDRVAMRLRPSFVIRNGVEMRGASGVPFKVSKWSPRISITNSIIAYSKILEFEKPRISRFLELIDKCENNTILYLGNAEDLGGVRFPSSCFKVVSVPESDALWNKIRSDWIKLNRLDGPR